MVYHLCRFSRRELASVNQWRNVEVLGHHSKPQHVTIRFFYFLGKSTQQTRRTAMSFAKILSAFWPKPAAFSVQSILSQKRSFATAIDVPVKGISQFVHLLSLANSHSFPSPPPTAKAVSPLPTQIQAWLRSFKTSELIDIVSLDRTVFGAPLRVDILQRVVVWQRDNMRQGTASTKGRADVRGRSGKAAPQKGRGKARVGSKRAPHFRGGGIAFGPRPRDFSTELPKKVQDLGLRVALSTKYAQNQLVVVDSLHLDSHKTRELDKILRDNWNINKDSSLSLLFLTGTNNNEYRNLELAAGNIPHVDLLEAEDVNVYSLLKYELLVVDKEAVKKLEESLRVRI
ncbi:ribosomal protein L4/L1 family-domain-containing protein [Endogone sp. FLAS-F59071]|nr:ribosomal protein L4/L1 family-domain-containing protein [Endogone sp. FLAS-F59071]|eukprot:RUS22973.1 ribosomal protein L4/L1 family-domain-containing protein [Endogone sp. FLAS-F59071]